MEKDSVTQNLDGGSWTLGINFLHWFKYETVAQNEGGGSRTLGINFLYCFVSEIVRTNEDGGSWTHGINFLDGSNTKLQGKLGTEDPGLSSFFFCCVCVYVCVCGVCGVPVCVSVCVCAVCGVPVCVVCVRSFR